MYHYRQGYAKPRTYPLTWTAVDIENQPLSHVNDTYKEVLIDCYNDVTDKHYLIALKDLMAVTDGVHYTVKDALTRNDNRVLSTLLGPATLRTVRSNYINLLKTNVVMDVVNRDATYTDPDYASNHYLRLKFKGVNPSEIYENYLVSLNGFFHPTFKDNNYFYVGSATDTVMRSGQYSAGLHHFGRLGKLDILPITESMIVDRPGHPLETMTLLKVDRDISDKTVLLVLGGVLYVSDKDVWTRFSNDVMRINWSRIDVRRRILDSKAFIDVSSLLGTERDLDGVIYNSEIYSDQSLRAYLTLPQSFLVFVDTPSINVQYTPAVAGPFQNQYYHSQHLDYALKAETGIGLDYFSQRCESDTRTSYMTQRYDFNNYLYERSDMSTSSVGTSGRTPAYPQYPFRKIDAYFVDYYKVELVTESGQRFA